MEITLLSLAGVTVIVVVAVMTTRCRRNNAGCEHDAEMSAKAKKKLSR